jgi:hypothetical protein
MLLDKKMIVRASRSETLTKNKKEAPENSCFPHFDPVEKEIAAATMDLCTGHLRRRAL